MNKHSCEKDFVSRRVAGVLKSVGPYDHISRLQHQVLSGSTEQPSIKVVTVKFGGPFSGDRLAYFNLEFSLTVTFFQLTAIDMNFFIFIILFRFIDIYKFLKTVGSRQDNLGARFFPKATQILMKVG